MKQSIRKKIDKFSVAYILFFISAVFMLFVAVLFYDYIDRVEKEAENSIQNHLISAARAASTYLTVEEIDLFHTAEDMQRPEWELVRNKLMQFAEDHRVLYVYYFRQVDDGIFQFIIDNDDDEEYMVTPEDIFDVEGDPLTAEATQAYLAGVEWVADLGTYTDSWDGLISSAYPVFNEDGTVYCAAGVDLSDEVILTMRNNIRVMRMVLIISIVASVVSGFWGMMLYRRKAIQSANANIVKSQFVSNMSHEIRTPLNAIIGMTLIGKNSTELRQKNDALNKIGDASAHLLGVINDVLDIAKIEANKMELVPAEFNFGKMLQKAMNMVNFRAEEKNQTITAVLDSEIPRFLVGDEQCLVQVLTNLISNAIKFTPEGGEVRLEVSLVSEPDMGEATSKECELRISVIDNGIGLSQEQQARLFKEYEQAERATSHLYGGTGLGLVISKKIIELMGGEIRVKSELGKGAEFIFNVKLQRSEVNCENIDDCLETANATDSFKEGEFVNKRMLLAEDVEINREIIISLLDKTGLIIDCVENGVDAVEAILLNPERYDIVFMDVQMPEMDGLEATRRIRDLSEMKRIVLPIIAMTANVFKDDIADCIAAGMDNHLGKPLDFHKVIEMLRMYLL